MILPSQHTENRHLISDSVANKSLFVLVLLTIFIVPVFPLPTHRVIYSILMTSILLTGTQLISRYRNITLICAILGIAMVWIADAVEMPVIQGLSKGINIVLFVFMVFDLVKQVSQAKMVTSQVLLHSINAYLMIGLVFSVMVTVLAAINPGSFSFSHFDTGSAQQEIPQHFCIYYTFVTLTTTGYGDFVPLAPAARSLAILISVTGQLYIAVVIAMLIGKYLTQSHSESNGRK